jgi:hypothetical protein
MNCTLLNSARACLSGQFSWNAIGVTARRSIATLVLAVATVLPLTQPAQAAIGTMDVVPAATLLLPYFETDLGNENGMQTTIRFSNTSASAIMVNVTLWTDLGVPTYNFPVYMTGYDTEEIDLRLLFKGIRPITATAGQDPADKISPKGNYSQDINFASCNGILPFSGVLPAATVTALRNAHTGQGSTLLSGNCGGVPQGDNIARGYITLDTNNSCVGTFPSDPNYVANTITNQNVLTGTVTYLNRSQNLAYGDPLVHVEASATNPLTSPPLVAGANNNTFYGRYVGYNSSDNREPLASITQARFLNGGVFSAGTDAIVWRDPGVAVLPFACNAGLPAPFPLPQAQVVAFDEQENPTLVSGNVFPYAAQRVAVSTLTNKAFGFLRMNLTMATGNAAVAGRHQSAVSFRHTATGAFGGALTASQITNASDPASNNYVLPVGP